MSSESLSPDTVRQIASAVVAELSSHVVTHSPAPRPGALLNKSESAHYLGATLRSIQHLISTGQLEVVHLGRAVRIRRSDLDRIIEHGTVRTDIAKRFAR